MEFKIRYVLMTKDDDNSDLTFDINVGDIVYLEYKEQNERNSLVGKITSIHLDGISIDASREYEACQKEIYLKDLQFISKYDY